MSRIFPAHRRDFLHNTLEDCEGNVIQAIDKILNSSQHLESKIMPQHAVIQKPLPQQALVMSSAVTSKHIAPNSAFSPASLGPPHVPFTGMHSYPGPVSHHHGRGFLPLPSYPVNFIPNMPPAAIIRPEYAAAMAAAMSAYNAAGVGGSTPINLSNLTAASVCASITPPTSTLSNSHRHHINGHDAATLRLENTYQYCDEVKRISSSSLKDE